MKNLLKEHPAKIIEIRQYSPDVKLFRLKLLETAKQWQFNFVPGQFILLSIFGFGEITLGIASSPETIRSFDIMVRRVGTVTTKLFSLDIGDRVNIRGPYGNGFPVDYLNNQDIIIAAGGTGLAPIASLIEYLIIRRKQYGKIYLLYGAKTPADILMKDHFARWRQNDINICLSIALPDKDWKGQKGLITKLCPKVRINPLKTTAIMVGPTPMYGPMIEELNKLGIPESEIYISLERRMRCGIGKCQHCTCGDKYVCLDGPVFKYNEIKDQI